MFTNSISEIEKLSRVSRGQGLEQELGKANTYVNNCSLNKQLSKYGKK